MKKLIILVGTIVGLLLMGMANPVSVIAQEGTKVLVQVDGLSCPFCSFGLEKKLRKIEGVEAVTIKPDQAVVEVIFTSSSTIDENKIREAVQAGGFTPREIRVVKSQTERSIP